MFPGAEESANTIYSFTPQTFFLFVFWYITPPKYFQCFCTRIEKAHQEGKEKIKIKIIF